jgi:hypothetical protein
MAAWRENLRDALGPLPRRIEHISSNPLIWSSLTASAPGGSRLLAPIAILNLHKGCPRCILKGIKPPSPQTSPKLCLGLFFQCPSRRRRGPQACAPKLKRRFSALLHLARCERARTVVHV